MRRHRQKAENEKLRKHFSYLDEECDRLEKSEDEKRAEIERLKAMNQAKLDMIHDIRARLEVVKAEAIKEFAERLKILVIPQKTAEGYTREIILKSDFDNLVKEMTEGKDAGKDI